MPALTVEHCQKTTLPHSVLGSSGPSTLPPCLSHLVAPALPLQGSDTSNIVVDLRAPLKGKSIGLNSVAIHPLHGNAVPIPTPSMVRVIPGAVRALLAVLAVAPIAPLVPNVPKIRLLAPIP